MTIYQTIQIQKMERRINQKHQMIIHQMIQNQEIKFQTIHKIVHKNN